MAEVVKFFVSRPSRVACASMLPPAWRLRCWRLGSGVALCCTSAHHCTDALRWFAVTTAASSVDARHRNECVFLYLLVPFFALQAPSSRGTFWNYVGFRDDNYVLWIASDVIGLVMRLVYCCYPGELALRVSSMLLAVIATAPFQVMNLRESEGRSILSLVIAAYLAFQHFTGAGGLRRAFGREAIAATLCIICMTVITLMLMF